MKKLESIFRRHGLQYTLILRNDHLAIFGVSGHFTNNILHFEVIMIRVRNDRFGAREGIPSDEEFGRTKPDRHFQNTGEAQSYYGSMNARLMQEVRNKKKKVTEYH